MQKWTLTIATITTIAVLGIGGFWLSTGSRALRLCDAQIQRELAAPSTYNRVESQRLRATDQPEFTIVYEAANLYGVSVRSEGRCVVNSDLSFAVWYEHSFR